MNDLSIPTSLRVELNTTRIEPHKTSRPEKGARNIKRGGTSSIRNVVLTAPAEINLTALQARLTRIGGRPVAASVVFRRALELLLEEFDKVEGNDDAELIAYARTIRHVGV
jgi:hypothetical protein